MLKLAIIFDSERIDVDAHDEYVCLFLQDLSQAHIAVLAALNGWSIPDDDEI